MRSKDCLSESLDFDHKEKSKILIGYMWYVSQDPPHHQPLYTHQITQLHPVVYNHWNTDSQHLHLINSTPFISSHYPHFSLIVASNAHRLPTCSTHLKYRPFFHCLRIPAPASCSLLPWFFSTSSSAASAKQST